MNQEPRTENHYCGIKVADIQKRDIDMIYGLSLDAIEAARVDRAIC